MKMVLCLSLLICSNLWANQELFSCRMGNAKLGQEVHLRGAVDGEDGVGVIKVVLTDRNKVYIKRYEVVGMLTSFMGGEISEDPFIHMRLQPQGGSDVLYFNFLVGYPELGSSHFVMADNTLFRGKCFAL